MLFQKFKNKVLTKLLNSWKKYCSKVDSVPAAAILHNIPKKDFGNKLPTFMRPDGRYTTKRNKTLQHMPKIYFLENKLTRASIISKKLQVSSQDWVIAKKILVTTQEKVAWTI